VGAGRQDVKDEPGDAVLGGVPVRAAHQGACDPDSAVGGPPPFPEATSKPPAYG
jgi:hypothetical protein